MLGFLKPEYLYRPSQLWKRLSHGKWSGNVPVRLPWGKEILVSAEDNIGRQIATLGLYDLVVTETLWRLCDKGETAIDVGANIGYTSFVMAERITNGRLICFEPHPVVFEKLCANIASLQKQGSSSKFDLHQTALGPVAGELPLFVPKDFHFHGGDSTLATPSNIEFDKQTVLVPVATLDSVVLDQQIGVMKMDVEGFELEVLRGGEETFRRRRVRDCVFEEHGQYPTPVTKWFEAIGYQVYRMDRRLSRPLLLQPDSPIPRTAWTPNNYLATIDPDRAKKQFHCANWLCLRNAR